MPEPSTNLEPVLYQLRVVLRGVSPLIWRRLLVRSDSSIADLHATCSKGTPSSGLRAGRSCDRWWPRRRRITVLLVCHLPDLKDITATRSKNDVDNRARKD